MLPVYTCFVYVTMCVIAHTRGYDCIDTLWQYMCMCSCVCTRV